MEERSGNWMKTVDVMKVLGVSRPVVTGLIHSGELDGIKIGKGGVTSSYRIDRSSLEDYIKRRRDASNPPTTANGL